MPGAGVEHDSLLGQHQASGLPLVVGVIAGRAQQNKLHCFGSPRAGNQFFESLFQRD